MYGHADATACSGPAASGLRSDPEIPGQPQRGVAKAEMAWLLGLDRAIQIAALPD